MMTTKPVVLLLTASLTLASSGAFAQESGEIAELRNLLQTLSSRLDALETSNETLRDENARLREASERAETTAREAHEKATRLAADAGNGSWADRIMLKGDFRLRHEGIHEEGRSQRNRNRLRARAAIVAQATKDVEIGIGLASGSDDPASTNQTLGGGGSSKSLNLDLAYFSWSGMDNTRIVGGKFKNFFHKSGGNGLLWDGDWNPEGLGLSWSDGDYFANALGTWLESDTSKETELSFGLQAGLIKPFGDGARLTAGIGYYNFGTKGKGSFYGDDDDFYGNSFDPVTNTYLVDYEEIEVFADFAFEAGGRPASLFFDYVQNQDASEFDSGYAVGFKYGKASGPGSWEGAVIYQDLERDAVFGLLTDSDFAGGGTDGNGLILKAGTALAKNWTAKVTYFITERNENEGSPRDYDRLQVDLAAKF